MPYFAIAYMLLQNMAQYINYSLPFSCSLAVKCEDILPKGIQPRFLENEGIYVCERIQIPRKMYDKMSNRLLNQNKVISQAMHIVFENKRDSFLLF